MPQRMRFPPLCLASTASSVAVRGLALGRQGAGAPVGGLKRKSDRQPDAPFRAEQGARSVGGGSRRDIEGGVRIDDPKQRFRILPAMEASGDEQPRPCCSSIALW